MLGLVYVVLSLLGMAMARKIFRVFVFAILVIWLNYLRTSRVSLD